MISIRRIHTSEETYQYVERLMISSFPLEERREPELQQTITDNNELFFNNVITEDGIPSGLIAYWNFNDFIFIEHFAIDPAKRNRGLGQTVLDLLKEQTKCPIVLETEPPKDETCKRRIGFYQRQGFQYWEHEYVQPPYRDGDKFIQMFLMVFGALDYKKDFNRMKATLYSEVYRVNTV